MAAFRVVTENRRARHDYFIDESFEVGIELRGTEVKSLRSGNATLQDSYAQVVNGEVLLYNMQISPYEQGNRFNHDPKRPRKLLLHKSEIMRLWGKTREKGLALVPLKVYFNERGKAKVELALGRGKKLYDKRHELADREAQREIDRSLRDREKAY